MIFGGIHDEYGPNPNYVWWLDGSYLTLQRFHEPMKLVRGYHKTLALDDPITGDFYIYHMGGEYVGYGSTLIEVWRLKWIRDPAFNDGEIYCPDWCNWGIENLEGICISPRWNNGQCGHRDNHPTYEKEVIEVVADEYKHMFNTRNPHVFDITRF